MNKGLIALTVLSFALTASAGRRKQNQNVIINQVQVSGIKQGPPTGLSERPKVSLTTPYNQFTARTGVQLLLPYALDAEEKANVEKALLAAIPEVQKIQKDGKKRVLTIGKSSFENQNGGSIDKFYAKGEVYSEERLKDEVVRAIKGQEFDANDRMKALEDLFAKTGVRPICEPVATLDDCTEAAKAVLASEYKEVLKKAGIKTIRFGILSEYLDKEPSVLRINVVAPYNHWTVTEWVNEVLLSMAYNQAKKINK